MVISNEAVAQFNVLQNHFIFPKARPPPEFGRRIRGVFNLVVKIAQSMFTLHL